MLQFNAACPTSENAVIDPNQINNLLIAFVFLSPVVISTQILNEIFDFSKKWEGWLSRNQDAPGARGRSSRFMGSPGIRRSSMKIEDVEIKV